MRTAACVLLIVLGVGLPGRAEVLLFKNGDQLTGSWQRLVDGKLAFKSEAVGDVSIPAGKVKSFASDKPAVIITKNGEAFRGQLSLLESGEWELRENGGVMQIAAPSVVAIYPMELYMPPGAEEERIMPWHGWQGKGSLGYSLVRGDRDANTISIGFSATRRQPDLPGMKERFRTNTFLTMLFANTRQNGVETSANSLSTGVRQDFLFTPTNFFFVLAQLDHIQTQSLDLRQTYGVGLGHDLIRSRRITLDFLGGTTYVREDFQTERRNNAELLLGEKLTLRISDHIGLEHHLNFFPNLTDQGEFRMDTTSTLTTRLSSRLSLNTTFTNRFLSRPLPGRQKNEILLTTGLGVNF